LFNNFTFSFTIEKSKKGKAKDRGKIWGGGKLKVKLEKIGEPQSKKRQNNK
jgi:hypothetical protein